MILENLWQILHLTVSKPVMDKLNQRTRPHVSIFSEFHGGDRAKMTITIQLVKQSWPYSEVMTISVGKILEIFLLLKNYKEVGYRD